MSADDKTVTEREAILRERAAFVEACRRLWDTGVGAIPHNWRGAENEAASGYPLPKVTRPRVVKDTQGDEWRFVDGGLEWRYLAAGGPSKWLSAAAWITPGSIAALSDLLANPTETVDA